MTALLSDEWVASLVAASADRSAVTGLDGVVELMIGKTTSTTIEIIDGRVVGLTDKTAEVQAPFTKKQLEAWAEGQFAPSVAFMKGDWKPVGSTGPLLALLAVLDDAEVLARL